MLSLRVVLVIAAVLWVTSVLAEVPQDPYAQRRALYARIIGFQSSIGLGRVPEMATFLVAVVRPGRCLSELEFGALSANTANRWLRERNIAQVVDEPKSLAQLLHGVGPRPLTPDVVFDTAPENSPGCGTS